MQSLVPQHSIVLFVVRTSIVLLFVLVDGVLQPDTQGLPQPRRLREIAPPSLEYVIAPEPLSALAVELMTLSLVAPVSSYRRPPFDLHVNSNVTTYLAGPLCATMKGAANLLGLML
ncbi:hypothetical protein PR003_g21762 [Phytophthora rubi]|uniref:Uncharacterized protein n=1 Tax=Phytophthora rubi TaxID=129364 RepID=A0A6A3JMP8_9STRA|nr:hypothetical protein PR001_g20810 [Phytophthora rubi]KAE8998233.1 hypothetical protein PR002_g18792 [Phytophthora rubi]KAE9304374.1 hypothetical protein PR003_g21762 [Phytophthora rubi]